MGRPKITEPRTQQLNLSLTVGELATIRRRAAALGLRPVHFGRAMLLDTQRHPAPASEPIDTPLDRLIHIQLVRLGNNLNQLMRHLHRTGGQPLPADLVPLLAEIRRLLARRHADDR